NNGVVYINGNSCKGLGRVCMDQMMVAVSGIDVKAGDKVEIYRDIEMDADLIGTITYELMSNISMRVKRVYIKNREIIAKCDYLGELNES
ncbi:alanine racemase C-terminal domain-containing protein, partial [uncultured Anaerococcus sp.]|uniref:alanine racemase C-terminal domain-containing protein n=1 Tax=uncultured Anaerococcus sp. TaxID=293428 RepID=UPI00288922AA